RPSPLVRLHCVLVLCPAQMQLQPRQAPSCKALPVRKIRSAGRFPMRETADRPGISGRWQLPGRGKGRGRGTGGRHRRNQERAMHNFVPAEIKTLFAVSEPPSERMVSRAAGPYMPEPGQPRKRSGPAYPHPQIIPGEMMFRKIRKAIIPAAGFGTRMLPATKSVPKELLPIVDRPIIDHIVEEAFEAGIEHIVIVTGRMKNAIEDHFDHAFELDASLRRSGKDRLADAIASRTPPVGSISFVRQQEARGLGHAVWTARQAIGDEP